MKLEMLSADYAPLKLVLKHSKEYDSNMEDPGVENEQPELDIGNRSGQQDTPLKPRHRRFFNAPLGATQGKLGYVWRDSDFIA